MTLKRPDQWVVSRSVQTVWRFQRTHMDAFVLGNHLVTKSMLLDAEAAVFSAEEVAEAYGLD